MLMQLNKEFFTQAIPGISFLYSTSYSLSSFSIDSRTLQSGEMFIALQGARRDGHDFIEEALQKGAAGCIVNREKKFSLQQIDTTLLKDKLIVLVPDTFRALLQLASFWRAQFKYPVVAITGSVGKTITKEILAIILDLANKKYIASYGNQNTALGVSLNILRMRPEHDVAIFELAISRREEMKKLVSIVRPTIALITGIGHSHMEGLGSIIDIAAEKRDIFLCFKDNNIGIVNGDYPLLSNVAYQHPIIKFGAKTTIQIQARKIRITNSHTTFILKLYKEKYTIVLKGTHKGNIFNSLAAASAAYLLRIPSRYIVQGIQTPFIIAGRFEERPLVYGKGTIINDCYNASPESMKASLLAFEHIDTEAQKICVLGDMLELGVNSPFWHRQLGRILRKVSSVRTVVLVGKQVIWTKKTLPLGITVEHVQDWQSAAKVLKSKLDKKSLILVKGSRALQLDRLVDTFIEKQL